MLTLAVPAETEGTPKMYPKTRAGTIEIKTIPESTILVTESDGSYFDQSNRLFYRLFDYIKAHDIPMTAPVEGSLEEEARMIFYLRPQVREEGFPDEGGVRVIRMPEREVASIGVRGSYREGNVRKYHAKLEEYLAGQDQYEAVGPAYSVFWNPPYIPWFLRRFEVHIPVKSRE